MERLELLQQKQAQKLKEAPKGVAPKVQGRGTGPWMIRAPSSRRHKGFDIEDRGAGQEGRQLRKVRSVAPAPADGQLLARLDRR